MKKTLSIIASLLLLCTLSSAQTSEGGISPAMMEQLRASYKGTPQDKALRNALNSTPINKLAVNAENAAMIDTHFSDKVKTKGITDQKQSGRCWLFTGLNFLRAEAISKHDLGEFQFSQSYCFFYDQLEKANLFLQAIIDTREKPLDDREVDWLLSNPIGDGGTFTGVANLVMKYGLVPAEIMPESLCANGTAAMSKELKTILRQDALELRSEIKGTKAQVKQTLQQKKERMLAEVYRVLSLCLGTPPQQFEWTMYNSKDEKICTKTWTPVEFYNEMVGKDLNNGYVMLMNDPAREYGKVYEIEYDRHLYDGQNWKYVNLPIEQIKDIAIASIKADKAMYFSCDVAKFMDREKGVLDLDNFDYSSLLGIEYTMDKKQRIQTHSSGSSHAMTLIAVDIQDEKPVKWMVENSWGNHGYKGKLIMTDEWFNEYMFRLVAEKEFVSKEILQLLEGPAIKLPAWDPMFEPEQ